MNKLIFYTMAGLACLCVYKVSDKVTPGKHEFQNCNNVVIVESKEIEFKYSVFKERMTNEPIVYTDQGNYEFPDYGGLKIYNNMDQHSTYKIWTRKSYSPNCKGVITKIEKVIE